MPTEERSEESGEVVDATYGSAAGTPDASLLEPPSTPTSGSDGVDSVFDETLDTPDTAPQQATAASTAAMSSSARDDVDGLQRESLLCEGRRDSGISDGGSPKQGRASTTARGPAKGLSFAAAALPAPLPLATTAPVASVVRAPRPAVRASHRHHHHSTGVAMAAHAIPTQSQFMAVMTPNGWVYCPVVPGAYPGYGGQQHLTYGYSAIAPEYQAWYMSQAGAYDASYGAYAIPYAGAAYAHHHHHVAQARHHVPLCGLKNVAPASEDCTTVAQCDVAIEQYELQCTMMPGAANKRRRRKLKAKIDGCVEKFDFSSLSSWFCCSC
jgi:hypothetical protein